ncbi:MAG TPA: thermonuclease family protein [Vineibacter sp.]|nr:thermonuclease family protein [Vineibacter sp.]
MRNDVGRVVGTWRSVVVGLLGLWTLPANAEPGRIHRIIDGDTVEVVLNGRVAQIRLNHIDTPETGHRALCDRERQLGEQATAAARELLPIGSMVELTLWPEKDRHSRLLANITIGTRDYGGELRRRGLALPYRGRGPKPDWCAGG